MASGIYILGIESSCDDTAAAVWKDDRILSNVTAGQDVHRLWGGVVPELASRAHLQHIVPVVDAAMKKADVAPQQLSAIAFTQGPGLIGSLLVGGSFAKSMAFALGIPLLSVHHMQAHILAHFIDEPRPSFPFLCLTVSGGHTQIVRVNSHTEMIILGETQDDAAGEAFDKSAKLLGLPYPGGPLIDKYAKEGNPNAYSFPEPQMPGLQFSFSGVKTAILYFLQEQTKKDPDFIKNHIADICASIQQRIITILLNKLVMAARQTGIKEVGICGGVSANSGLRRALEETGKKHGWNTYIPQFQYCTDNAAMIAIAGYYKFLRKEFAPPGVIPRARMLFEG